MESGRIEFVYSAGEASGDRVAAGLHKALCKSAPSGFEVHAAGICGDAMRSVGIETLVDCSDWGSIGIAEALTLLPKYARGMKRIKQGLLAAKGRKIVLVLIDFGYFNVKLAKWARKQKIGPIIYFMPPGSWKRRVDRVRQSRFVQLCDLIVTPFAWSNEQLGAAGGNSRWAGHPLIDTVKPKQTAEGFRSSHGIESGERIIALLPGSRSAEIKHILPGMLEASGKVAESVPGLQFIIAASSKSNKALVQSVVDKGEVKIALSIVEDATYDCLAHADFAIVASGTATLEAAILGTPMVIVYGGSWIIEKEYKLRRKSLDVDHIGLPNIIAGERILPEVIFLDGQGASQAADHVIEGLTNTVGMQEMKRRLAENVLPALGKPGVLERAAEMIWHFIAMSQ